MLALQHNHQKGTHLVVTVAVRARSPIDQAALAALVDSLPGLHLVPPHAAPPPHVLVWDPGSETDATLPDHAGRTAVLVLVGNLEPASLPPDVAGFFSKEEPPVALGTAIRRISRGEQYLSSKLALAWFDQRRQAGSSNNVLQTLTPRERETLALLTKGLSNKEIAARLSLSVRTVEGHLNRLYDKLDVHTRTEAALFAVEHGLP
jgi:two-component system nitrate/nitrite response regulator NarL